MDTQRVILFFALSLVLLLIWGAWIDRYDAPAQQTATTAGAPDRPQAPSDVPGAPAPDGAPEASPAPAVPPPTPEALPRAQRVKVVTDLMEVEIDTTGGDLRQVLLREYPVSPREPDRYFPLMEDRGLRIFVAQSGLLSSRGSGEAPDHYATYTAERPEYRLEAGQSTLRVPLRWEGADGLVVTKVYTFRRDSYVVDIEHIVENGGAEPWSGYQYRQFQRTRPTDQEGSWFLYTYTGAVISTPDKRYEKVSFDDMDRLDLQRESEGGWAAVIQHYFLGAWLPPEDEVNRFYSRSPDARPYVLGLLSTEPQLVAPGATETFASHLYVGPKEQERLRELSDTLKLTVDYGFLTILSQPLFWLLDFIHGLIGNWGWAIVIVTLLIKLVFYKLSETSYRSMANMRRVTPKIQQIRERYGDDRQRMSQAMMELYKKEKINPLGGCLPILLQIPVFIALYWVLLESVELRQAPFILWIQDLSTRDPYYILPLLMGISMFLQQRLNPPPPDPMQAKILKVLPFVFTLFFAFFPAGLVLYWLVNNVLSILQQWYITRRIEKQAEAARGG